MSQICYNKLRGFMLKYLILLTLSFSVFAKNTIPLLTEPIIEQYSLLSPEVKKTLDSKIRQLYKDGTGPQLSVLIIDTLHEDTYLEEFANDVFRKWGLGDKKRDDGVLFLIAVNSKKMRIEVGQGLEGILTDYSSNQIIGKVRPFFKQGNFDEGVTIGVESIISHIESGLITEGNQETNEINKKRQEQDSAASNQALGFVFAIVVAVALVFFICFTVVNSYMNRKNEYLASVTELKNAKDKKMRLLSQLNEEDLGKYTQRTEEQIKNLKDKIIETSNQLRELKTEYLVSDSHRLSIQEDLLESELSKKNSLENDIEYFKRMIKEGV